MRTLELFAGTQSFSKAVVRYDPTSTVVTVDMLPRFSPTVLTDIRTWDYTQYPAGSFDVVWCSPPCTEYSKAKTVGERDLSGADAIVRRCFEIIDYFQPRIWILENPQTGKLPRRMTSIRPGLHAYVADYCAYGAVYRKRTAFWSNVPLKFSLCRGEALCPSMNEKRHIGSCGNTYPRYNIFGTLSVWEKNAIPEELVDSIVQQVSFSLGFH